MNLSQNKRNPILKDTRYLQPLSAPPNSKPLHRSLDLQEIQLYLSEVHKSGKGKNLILCGKPGTGKTLCLKHSLNQLRRQTKTNDLHIIPIYTNAGKTRTAYFTLLEICKCTAKELNKQEPAPGWQTYRLKQLFNDSSDENAVVIGIDEANTLLFQKKGRALLYYLNRQTNTTLILVCNNIEDVTAFEEAALSSLQPKMMKLHPYDPEEALDILRERAENAFHPNVVSDKVLKKVAETTSKAEDIRLGLAVLLTAGLLAQDRDARRIEAEDIDSAIRSESTVRAIREIERLQKKIKSISKTNPSTFLNI